MNNSIMKDYYRLNEVCAFLSENLKQSFTAFDILFSMCERDIKLCFYHSGFIGVSEWDRCSGESVNKRIPFDGVLEIKCIGAIQEIVEKGEIFVWTVKPYFWIRHKDKQVRLNEELLKFDEPDIFIVNYSNQITRQFIKIDTLIVPSSSLVDLAQIFKKRIATNRLQEGNLSKRTENNYLRLILTLAHSLDGFNPKKPYEAAQLIIDETGIDISKQTLSEYITKAYELESQKRD